MSKLSTIYGISPATTVTGGELIYVVQNGDSKGLVLSSLSDYFGQQEELLVETLNKTLYGGDIAALNLESETTPLSSIDIQTTRTPNYNFENQNTPYNIIIGKNNISLYGEDSYIIGSNNDNYGSMNSMLGYDNSTSNCNQSVVLGYGGTAYLDGQIVFGSHERRLATSFNNLNIKNISIANAQTSILQWKGKTIGAVTSYIYLLGDDEGIFVAKVPNDTTWAVTMDVLAETSGRQSFWKIMFIVNNISGVAALVGDQVYEQIGYTGYSWDINIEAAGNELQLQCVGVLGQTIYWTATAYIKELSLIDPIISD